MPRRTTDPVPASFAQQRLWLLDRLAPGSTAYSIVRAFRIRGPLSDAALGQAIDDVVARHEALRTRFVEIAGSPVQVIAAAAPGNLEVRDLAAGAAAGENEEGLAFVTREARRPFDLERGPLFRALLARLGDADHVLLLALHHIIGDAWSLRVLFRELSALYGAALAGRPATLPELPIQYGDFAAWQRSRLSGDALTPHLAYWRRQLAEPLPVLGWPPERRRAGPTPFPHGSRRVRTVDAALADGLRALAREKGATPFMVLLAGFAALLGRYSGQDEVVIGAPMGERPDAHTAALIGFFANTVALRINLGGEPSMRELLGRARETVLAAQVHAAAPFDRVVEEIRPEREPGRSPVFRVMLNLAPGPEPGLDLGAAVVTPIPAHPGGARFDLTLDVLPQSSGLALAAEYRRDLFAPEDIESLLVHLERLLAAAVADPRAPLCRVPLLDDSERARLAAWGTGDHRPRPDVCVHDLVDAQATQRPDAIAVVADGGQLTYAALRARSARLAVDLRRRGVGPGTLVGICTDRSLEMVVALLAVLKAGAAYVPLDPAYPAERLALVLRDAGIDLVLTVGSTHEALPADGRQRLRVDEGPPGPGREEDPEVPSRARPDDLAYVIYTSGSTGQPKGVEVTHRSVVNVLAALADEPGIAADDVLLAVTTLAFDISAAELLLPLMAGARVVVASRAVASDGERLWRMLDDSSATVMQATPSTWRMLISVGWPGRPGLRILSGGEALTPELAGELLDRGAAVWNLYGPTETTIWASVHRVRSGASPIAIGRPIPNTCFRILDAHRQAVPAGVIGELCIGGAGLARGYRGRPDLTAERFLADTAGGDPGSRLYATGDLARWLPDGTVEVLGRADSQVKLRGFRIELGEIEIALAGHPAVRECAVITDSDATGQTRLVAYLAARPGHAPEPAELRAFLARRLPAHMVPSLFMVMRGLPSTPNGKIDRRALPTAVRVTGSTRPPRVQAGTAVEELIAELWADELGVDAVGLHDSFFDLGGHSLAAARLVATINTALGVNLPLRRLFERPTVAALAADVEAAPRHTRPPAPPIMPVPRDGPLPLAPGQERLWFLEQIEPGTARHHLCVAFEVRGRLDLPALRAALDVVVARHEALRTVYASVAGSPVQIVAPPRAVALEVTDLRADEGATRLSRSREILREAARRPFDLTHDLMVRASVVRLTEDEHLVGLTLHHIAADAWSVEILLRELSVSYQARVEGQSTSLPTLGPQYADFALWQRARVDSPALDTDREYWVRCLGSIPSPLRLPTEHPRPAVATHAGTRHDFGVGRGVRDALVTVGHREGATLFMTLLAAFVALLHRLTGQDDIAVGTPVAGRSRPEVHGLIGCFINTIVLRVDAGGDPTFRELLQRVREATLGALTHQELPFERLVQHIQPPRDLAGSPVFQVAMALDPNPLAHLSLPGIEVAPVDIDRGAAHFDLTLFVRVAGRGLRGRLEYRSDLLDTDSVRRMARSLGTVLEGIVRDPDAHLSALPLLDASERERILVAWNATARDHAADRCVHELFETHARRHPAAVAIVDGEREISYASLDADANRLAHVLREEGIGPDVPVGLALPRSAEAIVAMLAILKAGGAYLPLDPLDPGERLTFMVETARAPLVISEARLVDRLPGGARRLLLDAHAERIARQPAAAPPPAASAEHLAYVMFTSGSTGQPKGVMVPHRAITRLVVNTDYVRLGPDDVVAHTSTITFDAATFEIWGALLNGARVAVVPHDSAIAPRALAAAIQRRGITTLFVTTAVFTLVAQTAPAIFRGVRHVLFGGEAVEPRWVEAVLREGRPQRLLHVYGPTEATTFATWHLVDGVASGASTVPIGRPIANTEVYVLDHHLALVPPGVPGEICIGGAGLARGYLGDAELTAARFVPHPFRDDPGARLYRTGDRARLRSDGAIEFLGRADRQVKIRGFRIEPAEVEAALLRHPRVRQAAVVVGETAPGERRLVAHIAGSGSPEDLAQDVRRFVEARLPHYMVPSTIAPHPSLPLNAHGKVDRGALPPVDHVAPGASECVPAWSALEHQLVAIWQDLLHVTPIGVRDDFFDLGGHSLLAVKMLDRVAEICGRALPLSTLLQGSTIEHLAAAVLAGEGPVAEKPLVEVQSGHGLVPLTLLHGDMEGGGFYCARLARALGARCTLRVLPPSGLNGQPLRSTIETMAEQHLAALREAQPSGPYALAGWCNGAQVAFEMACRLIAEGETVALLALLDPPRAHPRGALARAADRALTVVGRVLPLARRGWLRSAMVGQAARLDESRWAVRRVHDDVLARGLAMLQQSLASRGLPADDRHRLVWETYYRAALAYRPRRYPGPVVILRPAEDQADTDSDLGWRRAAERVAVERVPGDHITCITRHLDQVAEALRRWLPPTAALDAIPTR